MAYKNPEEKRAYAAAWRHANKEKIAAYHRERRKADPAAYKACMRASAITHAEKARARSRAWYAANKERALKSSRERRIAHPEIYEVQRAAYHRKNAEKIAARSLAWGKANPERRRVISQRNRAKRRQVSINDLSHAQWIEIQAAQDFRCYYCHKRCKGKLTMDHIQPLAKDGPHTFTNIIGACQSCNSRKYTKEAPIPVQMLLLTVAPKKRARKKHNP